jgi:hypothetical protein
MALYEWGGPAISSTGAGTAANPSTATLVAEIDSTQLQVLTGSSIVGAGHAVHARLTAILGGSTICDWRIEQALSTSLDVSTSARLVVPIQTPTGQSGQYVVSLTLEPGDRVRARLNSSLTGTVNAFLQIDPLT